MQNTFYAGVDVGGTNIKIGIVDDSGKVVGKDKFPTQPNKGSEIAWEFVKSGLQRLLDQAKLDWDDIASVGLGTPGPLDLSTGMILTPTNLPGWHHSPIREQLSTQLGKPVVLSNDANAAAFGEYWVGSGRAFESLVLLTLGTGVGGGIIVDGLAIEGFNSHGAELGHVTIAAEKVRRCGCGQRGHLEAYASATALVERTQEALSVRDGLATHSALLHQISENSPLSALMIAHAASAGDAFAGKMIDETATFLGAGIATIAHVIDPEIFLLGGAMNFGGSDSPLGQKFLRDVTESARKLLFPVMAERLIVQFASLGGEAGFIGAAGLARQKFIESEL